MLFGILKDLLRERVGKTARRKRAIQEGPTSSVPRASEADWRRTLELMPNFAEAHTNLGVILKNANRLAEAEAAFRCALNLQADNVVALYNLGIVLAETHRSWEAELAYRAAIKFLPNFVEAHNNLGVVLMDTQHLGEAEAAFQRALELRPTFAEAQKNLGIILAKTKRRAEVEADCRNALALTPDSADAHIRLGVVLMEAMRLPEAEAAFRNAISLQGDNAVALYNLGIILRVSGRQWEAEWALRGALELQPNFVEVLYNLGIVLSQANRLLEAEMAYRGALKLQPDHVDAHNNLGVILRRHSQRLPEAEAAFRRAITLKPDHEAAHKNLEITLKEIERLSQAEAACRSTLEQKPDLAAAHYKLGLTLMALGKLDEAMVSFKQALVIEPHHADAHHKLGVGFSRQNRMEEAIACYRQAISVKPGFAKAMADLGAAYFLREDLPQAVTWNLAALAIEPQQIEANQNMALILLQKGARDEAKQHLDRASAGQAVNIEYAANQIRTVLILWTTQMGNLPTTEFLFPATVNTRVYWVIGSDRDDQSDNLPDHDLVFNAMGDPDLIGESIGPVTRFAQVCAKPLLNHPEKVARTARNNLPALLAGIEGIIVPAVWRFANRSDWDESIVDQLPLLIRPVTSHGGVDLELVTTADELAQRRAAQRGPVYVCRFVDFRSADSWYRKYRIIFVDRKPYPYHLAIAQKWMVHYYTAEMESCPWKLEEETRFLQDPEAVLGPVGMAAIQTIGERMDLEYSGIDFSLMADKRMLVFEANPTMLVHPETIGGPLEHKNRYVFRIQDHFGEVLKRF